MLCDPVLLVEWTYQQMNPAGFFKFISLLGFVLVLGACEPRNEASETTAPIVVTTEFHDVVLKNGTLPLQILEEVVDSYILSIKGDSA